MKSLFKWRASPPDGKRKSNGFAGGN